MGGAVTESGRLDPGGIAYLGAGAAGAVGRCGSRRLGAAGVGSTLGKFPGLAVGGLLDAVTLQDRLDLLARLGADREPVANAGRSLRTVRGLRGCGPSGREWPSSSMALPSRGVRASIAQMRKNGRWLAAERLHADADHSITPVKDGDGSAAWQGRRVFLRPHFLHQPPHPGDEAGPEPTGGLAPVHDEDGQPCRTSQTRIASLPRPLDDPQRECQPREDRELAELDVENPGTRPSEEQGQEPVIIPEPVFFRQSPTTEKNADGDRPEVVRPFGSVQSSAPSSAEDF